MKSSHPVLMDSNDTAEVERLFKKYNSATVVAWLAMLEQEAAQGGKGPMASTGATKLLGECWNKLAALVK